MPHTVTLASGHVISDDRARLDMGYVLASLDTAYWAAARPHALTERSWANCLCFGVYAPAEESPGRQLGFARLLTDYAMRAHLGDVFIDPAARGLGLGGALIETVLAHPELTTVGHWTLVTRDAHGLYEKYGFRVAPGDGKWMTLERTLTATLPSPHPR